MNTIQYSDVDRGAKQKLLLKLSDLFDVEAKLLFIDATAVDLSSLDTCEQRDVPTRNAFPHRLAHLALPLREVARQLDRRIEESVIDRSDLDGNTRSTDVTFRRAEAGHAFDHEVEATRFGRRWFTAATNLMRQLKKSQRTP